MKKLFLLSLILFGVSGYAQEFSADAGYSEVFKQLEFSPFEEITIGLKEVRPSLALPLPQLPEREFTIREVDFTRKEVKRQVNLIAMMERKRYEKEKGSVDLDSPMPDVSTGEKALIEITNDIRMRDRSSNFDIYTGQKKIPAYEEMQTPLFRRNYSPYSGRGYISPNVYYSP
ncbi:hypothetical protein [Salinimicrobium sp. HB62]|uniref:hypothetical protein n=1 Tax=Salinimicrobium sp. HB62 TaxID=3077781 RepID=UPI002D79BC8A|nr:hypothetical protein [Salinimicrobium sp. HB62]